MTRPRKLSIDPSPGSYKVYSLSDPRDGRVRYIGATKNLDNRLNGHIGSSSTPDRYSPGRWILDLKQSGLRPILTVLQVIAEGESWEDAERNHIANYRTLFPDLLNRAIGGPGSKGTVYTAEEIARAVAARKLAKTRRKARG